MVCFGMYDLRLGLLGIRDETVGSSCTTPGILGTLAEGAR